MPSTYSPSLRLELIGAGEQAANWNNTTNYNLGTLLEQAIAGVQSVAVSGASYTLTTGSGVADEARNAVLVLTGTLAASCNVIVPSVDKIYTFRNATTGGFSVVVKTAAGLGVTIASGFTQQVYCDATDVVAAGPAFNATTNLIPVNSGGTGTSTAFTIGSLVFAGAGGTYTQDNTNLFWDDTNNRLGIGTATPSQRLDITGNVAVTGNISATGDISGATSVFMPAGALVPYAGPSAPTGWLLCAGQAVSRTIFATLFAAVGTTYGIGDGATTFNLPDLRGRSIFGRDDMNGTAANRITNAVSGITATTLGAVGGDQRLATHGHTAQPHNHAITDPGHAHGNVPFRSGADTDRGAGSSIYSIDNDGTTSTIGTSITINNATVTINDFSGGASANIPPAVILNYIIKT
jgi:microcystin-dependent protein